MNNNKNECDETTFDVTSFNMKYFTVTAILTIVLQTVQGTRPIIYNDVPAGPQFRRSLHDAQVITNARPIHANKHSMHNARIDSPSTVKNEAIYSPELDKEYGMLEESTIESNDDKQRSFYGHGFDDYEDSFEGTYNDNENENEDVFDEIDNKNDVGKHSQRRNTNRYMSSGEEDYFLAGRHAHNVRSYKSPLDD